MEELRAGDWVHFIAIGGTGMGALALLLKTRGVVVTGSDHPLYPPMSHVLDAQAIPRKESFSDDHLNGISWGLSAPHPKMVVVGNAISRGHVEAMACERLLAEGKILRRLSFAQALAEIVIRDKKSLVVAGTHGKSTTTSLLAWALESLGARPGFFIGGIPGNFPVGSRDGEGTVFAIEGDEYDTAYWDKESKFLHYRAAWVLCTGIEYDHADIFADEAAVVAAFLKLVDKTKTGWLLIDDKSAPRPDLIAPLVERLSRTALRFKRYGRGESSDYCLLNWQPTPWPGGHGRMGVRLKIRTPQWGVAQLDSPMAGEHNALNAVGVLGLALESGELSSLEQAQKFLTTFKGIKRRQEEVFTSNRLVVLDDFAHHPTAIRETIKAVKAAYPDRKLAAFFEARSATSSRNVFLEEFKVCFEGADGVFLSPPTKTNIPDGQKLDINELALSLKEGLPLGSFFMEKGASDLVERFKGWHQADRRPTVALVMSNGPFQGIHKLISDIK